MNKFMNCRCGICDHLNEWGGEYREFPSSDICLECYSAITSTMSEMLQEDEIIYPPVVVSAEWLANTDAWVQGTPLDARPEPTSGQETTIPKETIVVEKDNQGTRTV